MKSYLCYFYLKLKTGIQYRISALAGICTQFFFGFIYVSVYVAFFESGSSDLSMSLKQIVSFIWLQQAFFALVYLWYKDKDIINLIKTGNIAYELCRPQDLYFMWAAKISGQKLSNVSLRILPVILFSLLLPSPYNLDLSIDLKTFIIFLVAFLLSIILITLIILFYHIICMFTIDSDGIVNLFLVFSDILSGLVVPIPFFPKYLQNISNVLPFRYTSDFPFRLYVGNIGIKEGLIGIIVQIVWITILFILGKHLCNKALNKAVVQGG